MYSPSSVTGFVVPRIVRSPVMRKRPPPSGSTLVVWNVSVGFSPAAKKSGERRCSLRFSLPVSMEAT